MNRYCSINHDKRIIMTDLQIIEALIARDENVTCDFFYRKCRPLFASIIRHVFSYDVDYDEFVNEFYLYLMEFQLRRNNEEELCTAADGHQRCPAAC